MKKYIDAIIFEHHGHSHQSAGTFDGDPVVLITKNKNHTHTNDGVYTVSVLGEELNDRFRGIEEARNAARAAFAQRVALKDDTITLIMSKISHRPFHTGHFINALEAIRPDIWNALVARYGRGGQGAGRHFSAFSAVAHALQRASSRGILVKLEEYAPAPPDLNWGSPVIRYWTDPDSFSDQPYPDEPGPEETYFEGAMIETKVNVYERNRAARVKCISHYGAVCHGCDMDFLTRYGERGRGFMHVHHLLPLSQIKKTYKLNPIEDLRPVCPNCHAMIHRHQPMLSIKELRKIMK